MARSETSAVMWFPLRIPTMAYAMAVVLALPLAPMMTSNVKPSSRATLRM